MKFTWTEDRTNPCALCVMWEDPEGTEEGDYVDPDEMVPIIPDGESGSKVAERVYRHIHSRCQESVDLYMAEHEQEGWL